MKAIAPHTQTATASGIRSANRSAERGRGRIALWLVMLVAVVSSAAPAQSAAYSRPGQHDFWGNGGCYPGYGTQDGNPRVVGWPTLMRRTPSIPNGTVVVFGGTGTGYGTSVAISRTYSAQWLMFRVLVGYYDGAGVFRQFPGYWLGGWNSLGSQTTGIESWVFYNNRWEKTTYSNVPGGVEDWSFVRTQKGSRYHIRFEYRWGPISATENGRTYTVYTGDRVVVNYGWVQC